MRRSLPLALALAGAMIAPSAAVAGGQQTSAADPGQTLQGPVFQTATIIPGNQVRACADRPLKAVVDPAQGIAGNPALALTGAGTRNILNGLGGTGAVTGLVDADSAGGLFALVPANDLERSATNPLSLGGGVGALVDELEPGVISTQLHGYVPDGALTAAGDAARLDPEDARCVVLGFAGSAANAGLERYLAGFTLLSIQRGAVTDLRDTPNDVTQTLALAGASVAQRAPLPGEALGPKLVSAIPSSVANTIDFNFSAPVDPTLYGDASAAAGAAAFSFITPAGTVVTGQDVAGVSPQVLNGGTTVRVGFPDGLHGGATVMNSIEGVVQQGGAVTQTLGTLSGGAETALFGGPAAPDVALMTPTVSQALTASTHPILKTATHESGRTWNLAWDQSRTTPADASQCVAVTADGNAFPGDAYAVTGADTEQITFPGIPDIQQVVRIVDTGGCVNDQEDSTLGSLPSEIDVAINHNLASGFTVGPDLLGAVKQPSVASTLNSATVGYQLDDQIAAVGTYPLDLPASFGLILGDGETVFDGRPVATNDDPVHDSSEVVMQFKQSEVDHAVGVITTSGGAFDLFGHTLSNGAAGFTTATLPPPAAAAGSTARGGSAAVVTATPTLSASRRTVSARLYRASRWHRAYVALRVRGAAGRAAVTLHVLDAKGRLVQTIARRVGVGRRVSVHGVSSHAGRVRASVG